MTEVPGLPPLVQGAVIKTATPVLGAACNQWETGIHHGRPIQRSSTDVRRLQRESD
jgi:hypothetical protein